HKAARMAARVATLAFDVLLASPYRRAHETATVMSQVTGKTPELCALFTERVKPNSVNGKPFTDAKAAHVWRAWTQKSVYARPAGGGRRKLLRLKDARGCRAGAPPSPCRTLARGGDAWVLLTDDGGPGPARRSIVRRSVSALSQGRCHRKYRPRGPAGVCPRRVMWHIVRTWQG